MTSRAKASTAPESESRVKQPATIKHPAIGAPPEWDTIASVGVSAHDLRFFAVMFARQFGMTAENCSAAELMETAISATSFDLDAVAEALGEDCPYYHTILNINARLSAAAEAANIVSMLLHNVRANT